MVSRGKKRALHLDSCDLIYESLGVSLYYVFVYNSHIYALVKVAHEWSNGSNKNTTFAISLFLFQFISAVAVAAVFASRNAVCIDLSIFFIRKNLGYESLNSIQNKIFYYFFSKKFYLYSLHSH